MRSTNILVGFVLSVGLLSGSIAYSYSGSDIEITGNIRSFDDKTVTLAVGKFLYEVPRKSILLSDIKANQKITIKFTEAEFKDIKPSPLNKK